MMRISMPLAGMDPTAKPTPIQREEEEDRVCRLQSEGKLCKKVLLGCNAIASVSLCESSCESSERARA